MKKMRIVFKRTKILATVGPAVSSYEKLEKLMDAGANGFRFNFSHGSNEERLEQFSWLREASQKMRKPVAILQDLQGPKIRLGMLKDDMQIHVSSGDELRLAYGAEHDGAHFIPVQYNLAEKVKVGEPIYIFDGKIHTTVIEVESDTVVRVRVENSGVLMSKKGINLPDTDFGGDILTEKDLADIRFGAQQDIDFVALSFVQSPDDIVNLRQILISLNSDAQIIAKIETKAAIEPETLKKIVKVSDGVMVARGDLAVEAGAEIVPIIQRKIVSLCRRYGKLSIVATQMMSSMVDNPEPTRAEVSDVATAVIMGADTVMLSDETAMGNYPIETVEAMKRTIMYTQENSNVEPADEEVKPGSWRNAIAHAAVDMAEELQVDAIVAETRTGATAASVAAFRPSMPIISVTSEDRTAQQLALSYATKSFVRPDGDRSGIDLVRELHEHERNFFGRSSDPVTIVVISGRQPGVPGETDTIRVRTISN
ncbi:pyruvate kinase [Candidatus Saccharibacteria bacterium]|jgi:pyruvate kinase|nr:pyruvate kinase [Candidatus Saccharibacteria bacterium]